MANFFDHLISGEVGVSAFLATLLDPKYDDPIFVRARAGIATVLKHEGLELSSPSPTFVEVEYSNIDLVVLWSGWTILVENKIAAASVTRGQLKAYYSETLLQLERRAFLKHAGQSILEQPLCVIYLTPTLDTGVVEFESFEVDPDRTDRKLHLGWDEVLKQFQPLTGTDEKNIASWFFNAGVQRIEELLEAAKKARLPENACRLRIQALMSDLKGRFQNSDQFAGLTFSRWSDQFKEQLFAAGPTRSAYIGLYVSVDGTTFSSADTIRAVGDISFDIASRHRSRLRGLVSAKSPDEWSSILAVASEGMRVNVDKGSITWRFALPEMSTNQFVVEMMLRVAKFLTVFKSNFAETVEEPAAQHTHCGLVVDLR